MAGTPWQSWDLAGGSFVGHDSNRDLLGSKMMVKP